MTTPLYFPHPYSHQRWTELSLRWARSTAISTSDPRASTIRGCILSGESLQDFYTIRGCILSGESVQDCYNIRGCILSGESVQDCYTIRGCILAGESVQDCLLPIPELLWPALLLCLLHPARGLHQVSYPPFSLSWHSLCPPLTWTGSIRTKLPFFITI